MGTCRVSIVLAAGVALLLATSPARSAEEPPARWDPEIRRGILDNGLSYFIRANEEPPGRVWLRLILRVGASAEGEDQQGWAHFCEHMSFNGSENFPPGELIAWLASMEIGFLRHGSAETSMDEVQYFLDVPLAELERALLAFRDFAGGATLSDEEVENERGVVLAEERMRGDAEAAVVEAARDLTFQGTRLEGRSLGGTPESIRFASPTKLRAFYRDAYQPHLMGLLIVGDVGDADRLAERVRDVFGSIKGTPERLFPRFPIEPREGIHARVVNDRSVGERSVVLSYSKRRDLNPAPHIATEDEREVGVSDKAGYFIGEMMKSLLERRLASIAGRPDAPYTSAFILSAPWARGLSSFLLHASPREGREEDAIKALLTELERVRHHGFSDTEIEEGKREMMAEREQWLLRSKDRPSHERVQHLRDAFVWDGIVLTDQDEDRLVRSVIRDVDSHALTASLVESIDVPSKSIVVAGPPDSDPLEEAELTALMSAAPALQPGRWTPETMGTELVPSPPPPGQVVSWHALPRLGVDEVRLSNGMRLLLKSVDWKPNEVHITAFRKGGLAPDSRRQFLAARLAAHVDALSGTRDHSPENLRSLVAGRAVGLRAIPTTGVSRLNGGSTTEDFEVLAQLFHAAFMRSKFSAEALEQARDGLRAGLSQQSLEPQALVMREGSDFFSRDVGQVPRSADYDEITLAETQGAWDAVFSEPSQWTVVLVGALDRAELTPVVERWLASIHDDFSPGSTTATRGVWEASSSTERGRRMPRGAHGIAVPVRSSVGTWTAVLTQGVKDTSPWLSANVVSLLESRLNLRLREELGRSYGVHVGLIELPMGYPDAAPLFVMFDAPAGERDQLVRIVRAELKRVRTELITGAELEALKRGDRARWESTRREPRFWLTWLRDALVDDVDPHEILERPDLIEQKTAKSVRRSARRLIDLDRIVEIYTVPSSTPAE